MTIQAHLVTPFRGGTIKVTGYDHSARRKDGKEPWVVVLDSNTERERRRVFKSQADGEKWLGARVDWSWLHPATQTEFDFIH